MTWPTAKGRWEGWQTSNKGRGKRKKRNQTRNYDEKTCNKTMTQNWQTLQYEE